MRTFLKIVAAVLAGSALGLAATWFTVVRGGLPGGVSDGAWHTSLAIGSASGDLYTRARVALHGLFALNRTETVYYSAESDDAGDGLSADCTYRIAGRDPDARWWSITAYGADDYLIANAANRHSISKNSVTRRADGSFVATVSRARAPGNWIAVRDGRFSLTLRLYNPGAGAIADPARVQLPAIAKVLCE